jgi:hypothetical protein
MPDYAVNAFFRGVEFGFLLVIGLGLFLQMVVWMRRFLGAG